MVRRNVLGCCEGLCMVVWAEKGACKKLTKFQLR